MQRLLPVALGQEIQRVLLSRSEKPALGIADDAAARPNASTALIARHAHGLRRRSPRADMPARN